MVATDKKFPVATVCGIVAAVVASFATLQRFYLEPSILFKADGNAREIFAQAISRDDKWRNQNDKWKQQVLIRLEARLDTLATKESVNLLRKSVEDLGKELRALREKR